MNAHLVQIHGPLRLKPLAAGLASVFVLMQPVLAAPFDGMRIGHASGAAMLQRSAAKPHRAQSVLPGRSPPTQVASLAVTSCLDDGQPDTLRLAVLAANPGDTINLSGLACSKITLTNGAINVLLDDLKIQGPGAFALTIDGNQTDRVFKHSGAGTLTLTDLTIANGTYAADKAYGGCIYSKGSVTLTRATVTGCKALGQTAAVAGGALAFKDMSVDSSTVTDNLADAAIGQLQTAALGGGLLAQGPNGLTLRHSILSGNTVHAASGLAEGGGAVAEVMTVKYSTVSGNKALAAGDVNNYSGAGGLGALYSLTMGGSTIDHNEADVAGGILIGGSSGFATILQSTISSNKGKLAVGGIDSTCPLSLANSTVAFNTGGALGGGGMVVGSNSNATLQSSILADNSPSDFDGSLAVSGSNNLVKVLGPNSAAMPGDNIKLDPLLQPLAFNGGATRTHALGAGSPALEGGSNIVNLPADQRGAEYARVAGSFPDIGAIEFDSDHVFGDNFGEP